MTRRELRASDAQRQSVRDELHAAVDRALDAWPELERQASDMGRGFPSQGDGPGPTGDHADPVAHLALEVRMDPATLANEWLAEFESWRRAARRLASRSAGLLPTKLTKAKVRPNSVEVCELCGDPIQDRAKRVDGQPFHAGSCYFKVWRSGRS